ncbi:MAG: hypothetical protein P4L22_01170 [Candidatus Babeliales bacterium]|nr:hypothetical protein [Candidatus Babeliales bacterium]
MKINKFIIIILIILGSDIKANSIILPDGKRIEITEYTVYPMLIKYLSDGSLDATFGDNGSVIVPTDTMPEDLRLYSNPKTGKIFVIDEKKNNIIVFNRSGSMCVTKTEANELGQYFNQRKAYFDKTTGQTIQIASLMPGYKPVLIRLANDGTQDRSFGGYGKNGIIAIPTDAKPRDLELRFRPDNGSIFVLDTEKGNMFVFDKDGYIKPELTKKGKVDKGNDCSNLIAEPSRAINDPENLLGNIYNRFISNRPNNDERRLQPVLAQPLLARQAGSGMEQID